MSIAPGRIYVAPGGHHMSIERHDGRSILRITDGNVTQADVAHAPYLLDASVTWKISESIRITSGQFKIPFSTESLAPDNLDIPIERARAVNSTQLWHQEGSRMRAAAEGISVDAKMQGNNSAGHQNPKFYSPRR